jgi:hypothetical protein
MDCLLMYLHTKRQIKLDSGTIGLHCWLGCLSLYLCGKLLLRNSATLIEIRTLDHFV